VADENYDVTDEAVANVLRLWTDIMSNEIAGDVNELGDKEPWHLFEATEHLIAAACEHLGMPSPVHVYFTDIDDVVAECECIICLVFPRDATGTPFFDSDTVYNVRAAQLTNFTWPGLVIADKEKRIPYIKFIIQRLQQFKRNSPWRGSKCT